MPRFLSVLLLSLSAIISMPSSGSSRFGDISPQKELVKFFLEHPEVQARLQEFQSAGLVPMSAEPTVMLMSGNCANAGQLLSGRCVQTYLISQGFLGGAGLANHQGQYQFVAAIIKTDSFANIPGVENHESIIILDEGMIDKMLKVCEIILDEKKEPIPPVGPIQ